MDRVWQATVNSVTKSWTQLKQFSRLAYIHKHRQLQLWVDSTMNHGFEPGHLVLVRLEMQDNL